MTQILSNIAQTIVDDLRGSIHDRKFQPRIWAKDGLDHVRIYTGSGSEHLRVYLTRIERSQSRMAWGTQIDDVLASDPTQALCK